MNIGQIVGRLVGELRASDSKALELRPGQVVKGEVVQRLDGQEALIKIQGTVVRARLEADLKPGQSALLQVQPNGSKGEIVLKTVTSGNLLSNTESIQTLLKAFQLQHDRPEHQLMLRLMQQHEVPLVREHARAIADVLTHKPNGISPQSWIQSAVMLVQRGLPVTPGYTEALHSIMNGPPLHQSAGQLQELVNRMLQPSNQQTVSARMLPLLQSLSSTLGQLTAQSAALLSSASAVTSDGQHTVSASTQTPQRSAIGAAAAGQRTASSVTSNANVSVPLQNGPSITVSNQPTPHQTVSQHNITSVKQSVPFSSLQPTELQHGIGNHQETFALPKELQRASILPESQAASTADLRSRSVTAELVRTESMSASAQEKVSNAAGTLAASSVGHMTKHLPVQGQTTSGSTLNGDTKSSFVVQIMKLFGIEHEANVKRQFQQQENARLMPNHTSTASNSIPQANTAALNHEPQLMNTVKSIALQLQSMPDTPPALKEAAQLISQQITGQQLMLTHDRSANFSHVALFVPLFNESGDQTAAISIQSRKSTKGGIDTNHCRLLFDLDMQALGPLMIDTAVADKRVQLTIYNDFAALESLITSGKEQITTALQKLGMELQSIQMKAYPDAEPSDSADGAAGEGPFHPFIFRPEPYKGVDLRI